MNFTKKGLLDSAGAVKRLTEFRARAGSGVWRQGREVGFDLPDPEGIRRSSGRRSERRRCAGRDPAVGVFDSIGSGRRSGLH